MINFVACGHFEDLARFYGGFRLVHLVAQEALFVRKGGIGNDASERERIDLSVFTASGTLVVESGTTGREVATYIGLAVSLGDADAMTLAVALHRNCTVATDDRKAIRLAREREISVVSTLEIIRRWSDAGGLARSDLRQVLIELRERGRYVPGRSHPLWHWWEQNIAEE